MQGETAATTAANHGHHRCSKCNWPYANPHPSAKQRRHHKKVCGKVQGYVVVSTDNEDDNKPLNADDNNDADATSSTHLNGSDEKQQEQLQPDESKNQIQIQIKDEEKSTGKGKLDKWLSAKSEGGDEFSDATTDFAADPLSRTNSIIQQANDPSNDSNSESPGASEKVEDQMENDRKEDLASSSDMPLWVDSSANKSGNVYSENTQSDENITEVKQVSEINDDDLVETLSSSIDSSAGKISGEESEIDSKSEKINRLMGQEISPDIVDACKVAVTDDEAKEAIIESKVSQADNGLKGFETSSSAIDSSAGKISGEDSEIDSKLDGLMEQEISPDIVDALKVLVTDDEAKEAIIESKVSQADNGLKGFETSSSAIGSSAGKISGQDSEIDSKLDGLMEQEISPDIVDALKVLVTDDEVKEAMMDSKVSQAEISPSHTEAIITREVNEDLSVHPENAHVDIEKLSEVNVEDSDDHELLKPELGLVADCSKVIENDNEVHLSSSKSGLNADSIVPEEQAHGDNLQQEEVTSKMVVQEVIVEGQADIPVAMDTVDNGVEFLPDNTNDVSALSRTEKDEIDAALGVQELHCGQEDQSSNIVPEAHSVVAAGADTIPSPSDAVNIIAVCEDEAKVDYPNVSVTSRGVAREESFTNPTEKSPVVAVCPSESMENLIHEDRNLDDSGNGVIHSCAENSEVKESMVASVNGEVEDTIIENSAGEPSDVHSRSLPVEEGNSLLKQQQSDSLVAGPPDCSTDTISQTDSVEANWGSVSDGTSLSLKDASDVQGTNTPVSMEAAQGTDPQNRSIDRFEPPSVTSVAKSSNEGDLKSDSEIQTLTSQGEKKEDGSAKLSYDSGKAHSTSLRSLLGSIIESKKVKTKQNEDGPLPKTVNSTTATESTMKTNQQKEWDSPARFPVTMHREKRKAKQWVPFMCCSSAVNLKTQ